MNEPANMSTQIQREDFSTQSNVKKIERLAIFSKVHKKFPLHRIKKRTHMIWGCGAQGRRMWGRSAEDPRRIYSHTASLLTHSVHRIGLNHAGGSSVLSWRSFVISWVHPLSFLKKSSVRFQVFCVLYDLASVLGPLLILSDLLTELCPHILWVTPDLSRVSSVLSRVFFVHFGFLWPFTSMHEYTVPWLTSDLSRGSSVLSQVVFVHYSFLWPFTSIHNLLSNLWPF